MIERNRGENADVGRNGGSSIETATHSGFEDDQIAFTISEVTHGEGQGELKEGGVVFPVGNEFAKLGKKSGGFFFRDFEAGDADAFAVVDEVRRGEKAGAKSEVLTKSVDDGTGGAFTIGASDVDDFGGVSREGEEFTKKPSGGLKAKLDAKGLSGVEPVERFFVGHGNRAKKMSP